jgi:hypothetical protein
MLDGIEKRRFLFRHCFKQPFTGVPPANSIPFLLSDGSEKSKTGQKQQGRTTREKIS